MKNEGVQVVDIEIGPCHVLSHHYPFWDGESLVTLQCVTDRCKAQKTLVPAN
jgi:hypothetical protein